MVQGVTLSTMHGCPPHEIEAICRYMLEEKGLNTFVKLNPTLLGYARVREILDVCGFGYIGWSSATSIRSSGFQCFWVYSMVNASAASLFSRSTSTWSSPQASEPSSSRMQALKRK